MHARHAIIKLVLTLRDESRGTVISHILRLAAAIGLVAAFCGTLTAQARATTQPAAAQDELIPLYDGAQTADWAAACSKVNGANGGSFIIANVAQGPGVAPLARWRRVIDRCDAYERASVIGYVWTDYGEGGTASLEGIEAQVRAWYSFYPRHIGGIFFDGASDTVPGTTMSNHRFYQTLSSYVHRTEGENDDVVLNYGTNPSSGWMFRSRDRASNADIVVTFEGAYDTPGEHPYTSWRPSRWERHYPPRDFAALVYDVPDAAACAHLRRQNLGYLYVGTMYNGLATYFSSFVRAC